MDNKEYANGYVSLGNNAIRAYRNGEFIGEYDDITAACIALRIKWQDLRAGHINGYYRLGEVLEVFTQTRIAKAEENLRQLCILARRVDGSDKIIKDTIQRLKDKQKENRGVTLKW